VSLHDHWEQQAHVWAAWARKPGHDSYEFVRDAFFEFVVPLPARATLDVACGEGRVSRDLRARGHSVTGVDRSPTLIELAREADPEGEYVVADAAALPFPDGSFDLVVSYNALMDFDDLDAALRESARVLTPEGRLAICIVHPMAYVFRRRGDVFVLERPYFDQPDDFVTVERGGLTMTFVDRPRTLEQYSRALEGAGFAIERLREISDDDPPVRPQFMFLRCVKRAP
jgi:ubiquinone/menaquinone biosynthesis C-methylase UbiE